MNKNHLELIRKAIEPIRPCSTLKSYLHGTIQSVIGAFVFMILLCGLLFILKFSDTQYTFTFGGNGSAKIERLIQKLNQIQFMPNNIDLDF